MNRLDETVKALGRLAPPAEVRKAMVERIAHVPLSEFDALQAIYLKYCSDTTQ